MPQGIVKWFNNAKGFGFILVEDMTEDVFAHYSAITMDGFRTLRAGQSVEFDITQTDKGLHAANIKPIGSEFNEPPPRFNDTHDLSDANTQDSPSKHFAEHA